MGNIVAVANMYIVVYRLAGAAGLGSKGVIKWLIGEKENGRMGRQLIGYPLKVDRSPICHFLVIGKPIPTSTRLPA